MDDPDADALDDEAEAQAASRPMMSRKAFVERVTERSGLKAKDAKAAVDATLSALAEVLREGQDVNLGALGKAKVMREREKAKLTTYTLKLAVPRDAGAEED